jgi:hypothetical protein
MTNHVDIILNHGGKRYLSYGFYVITAAEAKRLNGGKLPKCGHEALVESGGFWFWIARTPDNGKQVWSMRHAGGWSLVDGRMILGAR